ncbi:hypothetical protein B0T20DRAFT_404264 [Sordaria brevicollis]|uniref:Uncharacterized protein n=1 Tax=Sordaria brevicollis TaxID=83679 RepID=A0AAE0PM02_SORBR|nr:hypothetical protein B0T20DRAFT_404264 [Sordaria brevicollis]
MSLDSLSLSDLDARPQSRAQAPSSTCTPHRAPPTSFDSPKESPRLLSPQPQASEGLSSTTEKITTLHHLRSLVPHSYCIGIDVEGIEGIAQGITSVGISVLPPFIPPSHSSLDNKSWPWPFPDLHDGHLDLDTLSSHFHFSSHCFAILGRERARSYEHFHYGTVTHIPIHQVQDAVISAISQSIPHLHDHSHSSPNPKAEAPTAPIILTGFDMSLELRALSSLLPSLSNYITHTVDISSLCLANARFDHQRQSQSRKTHLKVSLRDTMLSLSFLRNHSIQPRARHHSAGMDAVRTLGVMLALLARDSPGPSPSPSSSSPSSSGPLSGSLIVVKRHTWEEHANRKLWEWLPRPESKFPWTVKVVPFPASADNGETDERGEGRAVTYLPESLSRPARLYNFIIKTFRTEPKAVAVCPPARSAPQKKTHGWVSFYTEQEMERFVREWGDGKVVVDGVVLKVGGRPPPETASKNSMPRKDVEVEGSRVNQVEEKGKSISDEKQHQKEEDEEQDTVLIEGLSVLEIDDTAEVEVGSTLDSLFQSDGDDTYLHDSSILLRFAHHMTRT